MTWTINPDCTEYTNYWGDKVKVGDLVLGPTAGYWIVKGFTMPMKRYHYSNVEAPYAIVERLFTRYGKKRGSEEMIVSAEHTTLARGAITRAINKAHEEYTRLSSIRDTYLVPDNELS